MSDSPLLLAELMRKALSGHALNEAERKKLIDKEFATEWTVTNISLTPAGAAFLDEQEKENDE